MISVLLTILKIAGIVILVLLGSLLTILLLVLFVPVRYTITANRNVTDEVPIRARIKVTWLLHILNMLFSYPEAAYLRVRVFCFTIFRSDQPKDSGKKSDKNSEESKPEATSSVPKETEAIKEPEKERISTAEAEQEENKPTRRSFFKKLISLLKNIKYTIIKIYDKIKHIFRNIRYYLKVIQSETFKRAFGVCKSQIFDVLKSVRPRKVKGNLHIGTGDPASTGQILSVYGMLYPLIGNNILITPDFEQQIVEGDLFIKGKITVFKLLKAAWKIYFNRDIRRVLKLLKREAS